MRLKTVLLPAPFGPIRPWTVPALTSIERSATAAKPPNCRETARSSSSNVDADDAAARARPGQGASEPAGNGNEPVGQEQHGEDQH